MSLMKCIKINFLLNPSPLLKTGRSHFMSLGMCRNYKTIVWPIYITYTTFKLKLLNTNWSSSCEIVTRVESYDDNTYERCLRLVIEISLQILQYTKRNVRQKFIATLILYPFPPATLSPISYLKITFKLIQAENYVLLFSNFILLLWCTCVMTDLDHRSSPLFMLWVNIRISLLSWSAVMRWQWNPVSCLSERMFCLSTTLAR